MATAFRRDCMTRVGNWVTRMRRYAIEMRNCEGRISESTCGSRNLTIITSISGETCFHQVKFPQAVSSQSSHWLETIGQEWNNMWSWRSAYQYRRRVLSSKRSSAGLLRQPLSWLLDYKSHGLFRQIHLLRLRMLQSASLKCPFLRSRTISRFFPLLFGILNKSPPHGEVDRSIQL